MFHLVKKVAAGLLIGSMCIVGMLKAQGRGAQSPASQRPPQTATPQSYPAEQVQAGQVRFAAQCGLCHGRDAAGAETGPDLTRSTLVAQDARGDKIGPLVRAGRVDKGMPSFDLSDADLGAIIAYIHDQKSKAETLGGGRRSVDVSDLLTGDEAAGQKYFNGAGGCAACHSPTGDLAGIAMRFQGLPLLQRMLYPTSGRPAPKPAKVTVTLRTGETVTGLLVSRDEFTIVITDSADARRTWSTSEVKFTVDEPLSAHFDQLAKYTDADIHNLYAYLRTLK
jgi:cytochrome c oxidase cbb3-type subunit 3